MTEQETAMIVMKKYRAIIFQGAAYTAHWTYGFSLADDGVQARVEEACKRALAAAAADKTASAIDREAAAVVAALPYPLAISVPMADDGKGSLIRIFLIEQAKHAAKWFGPLSEAIEVSIYIPVD